MSEVRVAVPSIRPGGLTAKRSGHLVDAMYLP